MGKTVLVPLAKGSEEMEAVIIIDILRRAGLNVIVTGENDIITCSRGVKIIPDILISDIENDTLFDAIVIPGGAFGTSNLIKNQTLEEMLIQHAKKNKIIGAICAAPTILAEKKILPEGTQITSHPSVKKQLEHLNYSENDVVISDNFVTSRGAGTAIKFALIIVEMLQGTEVSAKISKDIVY
ncbi:MAG: DJ-1 family glyoxalase III [Bacteroidota bacterium]